MPLISFKLLSNSLSFTARITVFWMEESCGVNFCVKIFFIGSFRTDTMEFCPISWLVHGRLSIAAPLVDRMGDLISESVMEVGDVSWDVVDVAGDEVSDALENVFERNGSPAIKILCSAPFERGGGSRSAPPRDDFLRESSVSCSEVSIGHELSHGSRDTVLVFGASIQMSKGHEGVEEILWFLSGGWLIRLLWRRFQSSSTAHGSNADGIAWGPAGCNRASAALSLLFLINCLD